MPTQPISDLGGGLRPPLVRGPPNSNNIVYNIVFSSEKKNYIHIFGWQKRSLQKAHFSSEKKKKIHTYISLVCRREDYKRPISHLEKKKKEPFLTLK